MKVDELRFEILAQHHMLRALMSNIADVAQKVAEGDVSSERLLRQGAHQLASELLRHMDDEERILEDLIREGHLPSTAHLGDFQHNHIHQRELLASFDARIDSIQAPRRLGELIEAMTHAVVLDMEHEEAALFGARPPPQTQVPPQVFLVA